MYGYGSSNSNHWISRAFDAVLGFVSAIQPCINERICSKESDLRIPEFFPEDLTWDEHWNRIKDSGHADQFRSDWNRDFRSLYCAQHPKVQDCKIQKSSS